MPSVEVFEAFLNSKEGQEFLASFNEMKMDIEDPSKLIIEKLSLISCKNYLDVGGGNGSRTLDIMREFKPVHTDFLEPSKGTSQEFAKLARGYDFSIFNSSFENFKPLVKYDLITAIHSWYYIELSQLEKLYNSLNSGGVACILIDSKEDTIKRIQDLCELKLYNMTSNNLEDLITKLDNLKINYDVYNDNRFFSGLLLNGDLTSKAKVFISLVSWRKWNEISDAVKWKVKELLLGISNEDKYPSRRSLIIIKK